MTEKTYKQWVDEATAAEGRLEWSEAARCWSAALDAARKSKRSGREAAGRKAAAEVRKDGRPSELAGITDPIVEEMIAKQKTEEETVEKKIVKKAAAKIDGGEAHAAMLAKQERVRAKQNKLEPGTKLEHSRRGEVLATCTYVGERDFRYRNQKFTSISAAANAAAETLGMKSRTLNGWLFWGVEKREGDK